MSVPLSGPAVGVDVGGTKIAGMLVDVEGRILARAEAPTPTTDLEEFIRTTVSLVHGVGRGEARAVGIGITGLVDVGAGVVRYGPNLPYREVPLRDRLSRETGLSCTIDNDATVAAWGEHRIGAGVGAGDMLLVTVGTGIGGGVVAGGRLIRGAHGFAGEIGHIVVEPDGPTCGCGNRGCWEQVASGRAIDRLGRRAAHEHPGSALANMVAGDPDAVDGRVVTAAAKAGDAVAAGVLAEVGRRLGEGIAGLVNVLDSEVVVVGGGAIDAGDLLLAPARRAFEATVEGFGHRPAVPLVAAALGKDAGGVGAALLAMEEER